MSSPTFQELLSWSLLEISLLKLMGHSIFSFSVQCPDNAASTRTGKAREILFLQSEKKKSLINGFKM